jgi:predicted phosphodiesterase
MAQRLEPIAGLRTREEALETLRLHGTILGIAEGLGIDRQAVKARLRSLNVAWSRSHTPEDYRRPDVFEQTAIDEQREIIRAQLWPHTPLNVLALSDLHTPQHCWPVLRGAFACAADAFGGKPDVTAIVGDIAHVDAMSSFEARQPETWEQVREELEEPLTFVGENSGRVVAVEGNHDARLRKFLLRGLNSAVGLPEYLTARNEFMHLVEWIGGNNYLGHRGAWVRLGNVALCHKDHFSSVWGRTATDTVDFFDIHDSLYRGLEAVIIGHTHHLTLGKYHDYWAAEIGCMCWDPDYTLGRKIGSGKKERWYRGCATFTLGPEGSLARNSLRIHDLTDLYDALPGAVASEAWDKPPKGLASRSRWQFPGPPLTRESERSRSGPTRCPTAATESTTRCKGRSRSCAKASARKRSGGRTSTRSGTRCTKSGTTRNATGSRRTATK